MNRYPALVRGEDGSLDVRVFTRREDAERHHIAREIVPEQKPRKARWSPERVGQLIGVSGRTIARRCEKGLLPYVDQGTAARPLRRLTDETVRLIRVHGLAGVARMIQAGAL